MYVNNNRGRRGLARADLRDAGGRKKKGQSFCNYISIKNVFCKAHETQLEQTVSFVSVITLVPYRSCLGFWFLSLEP